MKNFVKRFLVVAVIAAIGFSMASCTTTTIGGAHGDHGLISGFMVADPLTKDSNKIDSYVVVLGLFDIGYKDYAIAVKKADSQGKKITSVSRFFFGLISITTAYAK